MYDYRALILCAIVFLIIGASSPTSGEKELIVKLQGEVLVLQRQVRDLQESFDKWQGQSSASLQKISENTTSAAREISGLEDVLRNTQSTQSNNLAGTTAQLQRILEQVSRHNEHFSTLSQELGSLKRSVQEHQQKLDSQIGSWQPPTNDPKQLLTMASRQFNAGQYEPAIAQFREFLAVAGPDEDRDQAIFLMAESYFALSRYGDALREYDRLLSESPRGPKAASAFLKKGLALLYLERRDEGIQTLRLVVQEYSGTPAAAAAKDELNRLGEVSASPSTPSVPPPTNKQRPR